MNAVAHGGHHEAEHALRRTETQLFAQLFRGYLEASDAVRRVICDMAGVINDPQADEDEKAAALSTLMEAMSPSHAPESRGGELGIDLADLAEGQAGNAAECASHDLEEEDFARRLREVMEERGLTQSELAGRIGVGQPAIANMLARNCRPQRRTVERLAAALEVPPQRLWPDM
ncbi:MAG: helix-turn-helix transcriptional regulator [Phycisphaerales bacterium]|nr:helix-turn-helix transcriptional regulator [Phycisphaerales bacterium]